MFFLGRVVSLCRSFSYKMSTNTAIQSFIFFDLETTGLQRPIEITELCFIAVHKKQILLSSKDKAIPRLLDKMTVCVRPVQDIERGAKRITGLSRQDLEQHKGFDEGLAKSILSFILRQPQPSCMVAHNGDRFDFEILASEFEELGLEFPQSIKASDSYKAFSDLHQAMEQLSMRSGNKRERFINSILPEKVSFSLGNLYLRQTGKDIYGSHTAEGDTLALLELAVEKPEVLEYLEGGAHLMGCGKTNPGLSAARNVCEENRLQEASEGEDSCGSKTEANEVHEEYFGLLEKEGLLDIENSNVAKKKSRN
jgi:DNA polymerase III epsilon subunit-like protein